MSVSEAVNMENVVDWWCDLAEICVWSLWNCLPCVNVVRVLLSYEWTYVCTS